MTLAEQEQRLLGELATLKDPQSRLSWLVDRARQRPVLSADLRTEAHRIHECLAKLWFVPEFKDGVCRFRSESDSLIMKSMAGLMCDFYSGRTPQEISGHSPAFLRAMAINQHLTPNRRQTLHRIWEEIRNFAKSHLGGA